MTLPRPTRFYAQALKWLRGFSVVSISLTVLGPFLGEGFIKLAMLLPVVHWLIFWLILFLRNLFVPAYGSEVDSYLEKYNPSFHEVLRPWVGGYPIGQRWWPRNPFWKALKELPPDLREILEDVRGQELRVTVWPMALFPVCWISS